LRVETKNGTVSLSKITAGEISVKSDNGTVNINNSTASSIVCHVKNGTIRADYVTADTFDFQTHNGTVRALIKGTRAEYNIEAYVKNGSNNLSNQTGSTDKKLTANTNNGIINVRFV
jgi:DUF4097 and DUF4098 domain-containing protein YvlB